MPLLTQQEFQKRRPQGDYRRYLQYQIKHGGKEQRTAAQQAMRRLTGPGGQTQPGRPQQTRPGSPQGPGQRPQGRGREHGVYGAGGREGWLKRWNQWFINQGLEPMSPEEWVKMSGYQRPAHSRNSPYEPLSGSMPAWSQVSPERQLDVLNWMLGTQYGTIEEALGDLGPEWTFAGAQQYRLNQGRGGPQAHPDVLANPSLQNVSMVDPLRDESARRLLLNSIGEMFFGGGESGENFPGRGRDARGRAKKLVEGWAEFAPPWAQDVADQLHQAGGRFSTELFGDPSVQWMDPSKPLFGPTNRPHSLFGLGSLQGGEAAWLRQMSAEELMRQIYPLYEAYYHREAGSPAPFPGLTFGAYGDAGERTPIFQTDPYRRWSAYGQPGSPEEFQGLIRDAYGNVYNPFGESTIGSKFPGGLTQLAQGLASGRITPEMFGSQEGYEGLMSNLLGVVGMAAAGKPQLYWSGEREKYAPWNLDPDTWARLLAVYLEPLVAS